MWIIVGLVTSIVGFAVWSSWHQHGEPKLGAASEQWLAEYRQGEESGTC